MKDGTADAMIYIIMRISFFIWNDSKLYKKMYKTLDKRKIRFKFAV